MCNEYIRYNEPWIKFRRRAGCCVSVWHEHPDGSLCKEFQPFGRASQYICHHHRCWTQDSFCLYHPITTKNKSINSFSFEFRPTVNVDVLHHFKFREWYKMALVQSCVFNLGICNRQCWGDVRFVLKSRVSGTVVSSFHLEIFKYPQISDSVRKRVSLLTLSKQISIPPYL